MPSAIPLPLPVQSTFFVFHPHLSLPLQMIPSKLSQAQSVKRKKMPPCNKSLITASSLLKNLLLFSSSLSILYLLLFLSPLPTLLTLCRTPPSTPPPSTTSLRHIVFGIASSARSWPGRNRYIRAWYNPQTTRAYAFLDRIPSDNDTHAADSLLLPPVRISEDTSRFPYTFRGGLRSAIRVARIVKEIVGFDLPDVRWIVLGDDDTVFLAENLARTLGKYDWERWFYVGGNSESLEQNLKHSFDMAFGGGGFAISYPLARVLARVLDSCLVRYSFLYGSDSRVHACLVELGVGLTRELGFHQVDIRGDLFGMLSSHPQVPLVSLHHLDYVEAIFPNMTRIEALEHLFQAVHVDSGRVLQQTVCYDRSHSRTISVSWGYAVQVFEGNKLLPDLFSLQQTFMPWKRGRVPTDHYMFKTREFPKDPCKRPAVFFLESVVPDTNGTQTHYKRHIDNKCVQGKVPTENMEQIRVFSLKLNLGKGELQAPRRHCCDVLPSSTDKHMEIDIRKCKDDELISINLRQ